MTHIIFVFYDGINSYSIGPMHFYDSDSLIVGAYKGFFDKPYADSSPSLSCTMYIMEEVDV